MLHKYCHEGNSYCRRSFITLNSSQTADRYNTARMRSYICSHSSQTVHIAAEVSWISPLRLPSRRCGDLFTTLFEWQQPISLVRLPLFPSLCPAISLSPRRACPTPLQEGGCDWLMYTGVDSDININQVPPSGHRLTPTPREREREESGFIILHSCRFLFSGPCCCVHQAFHYFPTQ